MGLRDDLIPTLAEALDIENEIIDGEPHILRLLEYDGRNSVFKEPLFEFTSGIKKSYDKFRQKPSFEIYTLEDIGSIIRKISHISWDDKIFSVGTADIDEPDNDRWSWLFYGAISDNILE